jgi:N4-gp56 family major capsid protein
MGNTNVYGDISPRTAAYAAVRLLTRGQYDLVTERFGQAKPIPKKHTKTIKFRRYESLPRATAPLAEGIPPAGRKLTKTDVSATLEQYGDVVELTDVIKDTHEDDVFKEAFDLCGEQAAETLEVIRIAVLKAGSNVFYANNAGSRSAVDSPPLRSDFRRIYRSFKKNKAKTISKIVKASPLISTEPVDAAYFVMGHTDLDADIRNIEGFIPVKEYSSSDKALPAEIGSVDQFRFILTPLFESWETSGASGLTYLSGGEQVSTAAQCDVYPLIVVAQDAYGIVPLQGEHAVHPAVVNPKPVIGDPLGQKGFVSWKTYQAAVILNHNWIARLECAATAVPTW